MTAKAPSERWAHFRFAIIGPLLAAPPADGELRTALSALAAKTWEHPITGLPVTFGFATIERWYYQAKRASQDPVGVLRRRRRTDAGTRRSLSTALIEQLQEQYRQHPGWTVQLHVDNLVAQVRAQPTLGPMPSYATVRRYMRQTGMERRRRPRPTEGAERAALRKSQRETRSYESSYAHALWHADFHEGSRQIVTTAGRRVSAYLFGVIDDHSRVVTHLQWYTDQTAERFVHGLCQAFGKHGLPRALMTDNGSAMIAAELRDGLARLGIVHELTLPYSPEQNAKQESFWGNVEGRLMPMLEGHEPLTLSVLNTATVAWLTQEYHNKVHRELGCSPFERLRQASDVSRQSPRSDALAAALRTEVTRKPRRSDGTLSLAGQRYEIPSRYRHLSKVNVRYARWDLSAVDMVDPDAGTLLCPLYPLDKAANADGRRRRLETPDIAPSGQPCGMAPLLKEMIAAYAATGLPPAYLPSDEELAP